MNSPRKAISLARTYRDAALALPHRVLNYSELPLHPGRLADYAAVRKLGRGRFGEVFQSVHLPTRQRCVVKVLKPLAQWARIKREVAILQLISDVPNTSTLLDVLRDEASDTTALVFPYLDNLSTSQLFTRLTLEGARSYLWRLLHALDAVHAMGVVHRDVKPGNVILDADRNQLSLIDWGLADFYVAGQPNNTRVSTRPFKAPELLLGMRYYDYGVDVWAAGCVAAGLFFLRHPFFFRRGDEQAKPDPLIHHALVLGTGELEDYMHKFGLKFTEEQLRGIRKRRKRVPWNAFVDDLNRNLCCDAGFDLLDRMLRCVCVCGERGGCSFDVASQRVCVCVRHVRPALTPSPRPQLRPHHACHGTGGPSTPVFRPHSRGEAAPLSSRPARVCLCTRADVGVYRRRG